MLNPNGPYTSAESFTRFTFKEDTFQIVSNIAYLIGVRPQHFIYENDDPAKAAIFKKLNDDKNARIIRNLCIVRTAIERNVSKIVRKGKIEYTSFMFMPEYVPQDSVRALTEDGVKFFKKSNKRLAEHVIEINRVLSDRINNVKNYFPMWLNWQYVKSIFVTPEWLTEAGIKAAADNYFTNYNSFPYHCFINWQASDDGNILYNDRKFVKLLYEQHDETFDDDSKVSNVNAKVKGALFDFIKSSEKIDLIVDCENSDPFKLCATLQNIEQEYREKLSKIILVDGDKTTPVWGMLNAYITLPVEHMKIERVKAGKSLVDIRLTAKACQEFFQENVTSFLLASSDSDYWGLISALPDARFLVMAEHEKCGYDIKEAMKNNGIFYCFIDDFYSGESADELKKSVLLRSVNKYVSDAVTLNLVEMLDTVLDSTGVTMEDDEKQRFYNSYIKKVAMEIADDGKMILRFKT